MNRSLIGWIVVFVLAVGGAAFAWLWFAGGTGEPSTELTTPTIVEADGLESFVITNNGASVASFEIDEELRGSPQHVVGTTTEVAGQMQVDVSDLSTAQFSDIVINARTLQTDSERRDRAIRGPVILNSASDEFEFVTFSPTSVVGLDGGLTVGESVEFMVIGNLTIKGTTNETSFEVVASQVDPLTIEGTAKTMVLRSDFDIGIPTVPGIANVTDEVILTLEFTAVAG